MAAETVLITGANGFIGLHTISHCFKHDWDVVALVRSEKAADRIRAIFPQQATKGQLKVAIVEGISKAEFYKAAFEANKVTTIINVASPIIYDVADVATQILDPAIQSATAVLEAAAKYGGQLLRRVVHVSSGGAFMDVSLGNGPGKLYTSDDWNPMTYEEAVAGGPSLAYMASKALAERAMWSWMKEHSSAAFDLVSVAPAAVFGKQFLGALEDKETIDLNNINLSATMLWALASPELGAKTDMSFHMGGWVYVDDLAEALCQAAVVPSTGGQRIICCQKCHWQLIRDTARSVLPELRDRIDAGDPGLAEREKDLTYDMDGQKMVDLLGVKYTSLAVALKEAYGQLLAAEGASN